MAGSPFVAVSAMVAALAVAVVAVWKAWRTRAVRLQFERMYSAAHHPSRRLVEVLGLLRSTQTGQLLLVVDVRTGEEAMVWLRFHHLGRGDLALLVWMDLQWVVMDRRPLRRLHPGLVPRPLRLCGDARDRTRAPLALRLGRGVAREGGRHLRH